jgi:hypothetical protein
VYSLADGSLLIGAHFRTDGLIGRSIHIMGVAGSIQRSLGAEQRVAATGRTALTGHHFALSPNQQTLWLADQYSLDQWRLMDNVHLGRIEVHDVPWLAGNVTERGSPGASAGPGGGAAAHLVGIDTLGQLWIVGRIPVRAARAGIPDTARNATYVLDVFDPRSGSVRSSQSLSVPMQLFAGGDLAHSGAMDANGLVTISVWRFRFVEN